MMSETHAKLLSFPNPPKLFLFTNSMISGYIANNTMQNIQLLLVRFFILFFLPYAMTRATFYVVDMNIRATSLYGDTVIT